MKMQNRFADGFHIHGIPGYWPSGYYMTDEFTLDEVLRIAQEHEFPVSYVVSLDGGFISTVMVYDPRYGVIEDVCQSVKRELESRKGMKSWVNCETMGEEKEILRKYLLGHGYDFEISDAGYGMSHFEILCTDEQRGLIQEYMDANL